MGFMRVAALALLTLVLAAGAASVSAPSSQAAPAGSDSDTRVRPVAQANPNAQAKRIFKQASRKIANLNTAIRQLLRPKAEDIFEWMPRESRQPVYSLGLKMQQIANEAISDLKKLLKQRGLSPARRKAIRAALTTFRLAARYGEGWAMKFAETIALAEARSSELEHDIDKDGIPWWDDQDDLAELQRVFRRGLARHDELRLRIRQVWLLANQLFKVPVKPKLINKSMKKKLTPEEAVLCGGAVGRVGQSSALPSACPVIPTLPIAGTWELFSGQRIKITDHKRSIGWRLTGSADGDFGTAALCGGNPEIQWWLNPAKGSTTAYVGQILTWAAPPGCKFEGASDATWTLDGNTLTLHWGGRNFVLTRVGSSPPGEDPTETPDAGGPSG